MAAFPKIKPTNRSFTLGDFPVKTYRSLSGKVIRRSFGNKPFGATIDLSFENITEAKAKEIYNHYYGQQGTLTGFTLPAEVYAGLTASELGQLFTQGGPNANTLEWLYSEPPEMQSVYKGITTVSVKLVAEFLN